MGLAVTITEGKIVKGGINKPNSSNIRPPAPRGSNGKYYE